MDTKTHSRQRKGLGLAWLFFLLVYAVSLTEVASVLGGAALEKEVLEQEVCVGCGTYWNSLGRLTGVCCSAVSDPLQPRGRGPPGSSVRGILQARILEWVVVIFSRGSSQPRD